MHTYIHSTNTLKPKWSSKMCLETHRPLAPHPAPDTSELTLHTRSSGKSEADRNSQKTNSLDTEFAKFWKKVTAKLEQPAMEPLWLASCLNTVTSQWIMKVSRGPPIQIRIILFRGFIRQAPTYDIPLQLWLVNIPGFLYVHGFWNNYHIYNITGVSFCITTKQPTRVFTDHCLQCSTSRTFFL